ncbi:MAG: MOSC domain-containing protein [Bacteroidota bacterium]
MREPALKPHVAGLFIAPEAGVPMQAVDAVRAVTGRGLEGDRYFLGIGSFSRWPAPHREVTLIAKEALDTLAAETGTALTPAESRRNILTVGVPLPALRHRRFQGGEVWVEGMRPCAPSKYLARLTDRPDLVRALTGRGGLRARLLTDGVIRRGDPVRWSDDLTTPVRRLPG